MDDKHLEQLDAYIQVAVLGAYADGVLADEERLVIRECVATHAKDEETARLLFSFTDRLPSRDRPLSKSERRQRVIEIKSVLTEREERERAFVLAVDVTNAKGGIGVRESSVLLQLMFDLEIDGDFARRIVQETSRAGGAKVEQVTQPDAARTLRSVGQTGSVGPELQATLRSSTDESRQDEAREAVTLPLDGGWDESALTERRPPEFESTDVETERPFAREPESRAGVAESAAFTIQPESPRP